MLHFGMALCMDALVQVYVICRYTHRRVSYLDVESCTMQPSPELAVFILHSVK